MVGWGELAVSTMSNLNPSWIELELGLGFDNKFQIIKSMGFDTIEINLVFAKLSPSSNQIQLQFALSLALFPYYPATQPSDPQE